MMTMQQWFDAYGESHQNPTNKSVHWICVPTIFYSLIGLLSLIPLGGLTDGLSTGMAPYVHVGMLVILLGMIFFLRLSVPIAAGMLVVSAVVLYLVKLVNLSFPEWALWVYIALFVAAWIGQFIGHKIEGQKPSFFDDLKFLLIGPAWLLHFIYRKVGIRY